MKAKLLLIFTLMTLSTNGNAAMGDWFVRPYLGASQMSDLNADFNNINGLSGNAHVDLSSGFTSGLSVGYHYNKSFSAELGWEYRSNDSTVKLNDTTQFNDGNYASNLFYLNGNYSLRKTGKWQPYLGTGITWLQEIDIDLENQATELSYSGSGEVGYQIFAGVNYDLSERWEIQTEARYGRISGIDLKAEGSNTGMFKELDYNTTTLQIGLVFKF